MRALSKLSRIIAIRALAALFMVIAFAASGTQAHASQFLSLYNRPDLKWFTIETEHFLVHYPVSKEGSKHPMSGEWAARKVAKVSEQYWEPMCAEFDYYLEEKVHIVVLEQYDQLQGFTIPSRNWVEISGNPGSSFYRSRGRSEWFSNVLVHEFAHVVSLKKNQATAENVSNSFIDILYSNNALGNDGRDADVGVGVRYYLNDRAEPWWWTEGGAEYWSGRSGYNWWTSGRDRLVRTTILEDRALTYDQWKSNQQAFDYGDGERGYQQGHSMALYMRIRFGEEAFAAMAKESDKAWRLHWETILEEQTGVPPRQLYDDWKAWVEEYYQRWYGDIKAQGEVQGRELESRLVAGDFRTPADRDEFYTAKRSFFGKKWTTVKKRREWEGMKDSTGRADVYAKYSDDGEWFAQAYGYSSTTFMKLPEMSLSARTADFAKVPSMADPGAEASTVQAERGRMRVTIPTASFSDFDFIPGEDRVVVSMPEDALGRLQKKFRAIRLETDGYDWNQLVVMDLSGREVEEAEGTPGSGRTTMVRKVAPDKSKGGMGTRTYRTKPGLPLTLIPNTQRGTHPAVSPDGKQIAYLEYGDGTHNLVLIDLNGENKRYLTEFESGEMLQSVDWSPDGKTLVFAIFKNYQADIWFMDVETGEVTALNQDPTEELDVHWSIHDGMIYFSSDATDIYNIYRYNPETGRIAQLTNVISSASTPHLTPSGDLMYSADTAFGHKNYIVAKDEFLEEDVTDAFGLDYDEERAQDQFAYTEDLSEFEALTSKYQPWRRFHPPSVVPIIQFSNPSLPTFQLETGIYVSSFDVGEKQSLTLYATAGTSYRLQASYTYNGWHPEITLGFAHGQSKSDIGFLVDDDDDPNTLDDQNVYEFRQNNVSSQLYMFWNYPLNNATRIRGSFVGFDFGFRGRERLKYPRFNRGVMGRIGIEYSNFWTGVDVGRLAFGAYGINPRGRYVTFDLGTGYTDHVSPANNGVNTDDGERLDNYVYNSFNLRWSEHMRFPFSRKWAGKGHSLTIDVQAGAMDRNVQLFDELRGGGRWPAQTGTGAIQPTQPLAGYPAVFFGETMFVGGAYWRMPIFSRVNDKFGPLYVRDVYLQWGGSAGNFWSFRPPEESDVGKYYFDNQGNRIAYDRRDVKREIPFYHKSYKNGNYLLTDLSAELRFSTLLAGNSFNSIFRVSYGFQEVTGVFDVDGDDINDSTNDGSGNAISLETEKPGPRIFLGIGTGF